jgi:hypothetical protein
MYIKYSPSSILHVFYKFSTSVSAPPKFFFLKQVDIYKYSPSSILPVFYKFDTVSVVPKKNGYITREKDNDYITRM